MKPKLRFKEFSRDWEEKKLGNVCQVFDGTHQTPEYVKKGIKFLSVENIKDIYNSNKYITEYAFKKEFKNNRIYKNDILMTRIGDIGTATIVDSDEPFAYYVSLALLKCNKKINPYFLTQLIACQDFQSELWKRTLHIAFPKKINKGEIGECKIKLPSLPEQSKIADFLSIVDEKIQNQQDKITHLENIKKGFMQKIFSRKIRFKDDDGNEFPEWEEKKLEEIAYLKKGVQLDKDEIVEGGKYYHLNGGINPSNYTNKYNVRENTISISEGGNSCGYINWNKEKFFSGGHNYTLQNVSSFIDKYYLYQYLKYNEEKIMRLRVGSGLPNIQQKDLNKFIIKVPLLIEQEKIADFLSSFDNKIDVEKDTLNHLKGLKKGLLQQMFV